MMGALLAVAFTLACSLVAKRYNAALIPAIASMVVIWVLGTGEPRDSRLTGDLMGATVIAYRFDEGHAIYLWLSRANEKSPLALKLPWSTKAAQSVQGAFQRASGDGGSVVMKQGSGHDPNSPTFDVNLQPLPLKGANG